MGNNIFYEKNTRLRGFFQNRALITDTEIDRLSRIIKESSLGLSSVFIRNFEDPKNLVVHIRGGDYFQNPHLGLIPPDTYKELLRHELETRYFKRIFVVTDDEDHASKCVPKDTRITILGPMELSGLQTLAIMSRSANLVIANSSLSYLAAMLGEKRVIYPSPFFRDEIFPENNIPKSWQPFEVRWL